MTEEHDTPQGTVDDNAPLTEEQGAAEIAKLFGDEEPDEGTPGVELDDEGDGDVDDLDDADTDDEDTSDEQAKEPDDGVTVKVGDETVTLAELKRGFLRQSDYTRKTQEVAAVRKETEALRARATHAEQYFAQQAEMALQIARQYLPTRPDPALIHEDIFAYQQQEREYQERMGQYQQLQYAVQQRQAYQQQETETRKVQERNKLFERLPHLKDAEKRTKFQKELAETLPEYGFSVEELNGWLDHRVYAVLEDAMKFRAIQRGKKEALTKAKQAPPVQKPKGRGAQQVKRSNAARQLRETGDFDAGVAAIAELID